MAIGSTVTRSVLVLLLLLLPHEEAAHTTSAKWWQTRAGIVNLAIKIKRRGELCENERADVFDETLTYAMECAGETYELIVPLQHPVDEGRAAVRRERAEVIVTLHKSASSTWWTSLAKHPEKFNKLLERDFHRGDSEPDPDEEQEDDPAMRVGVDASGQPIAGSAKAKHQALMEDLEDAIDQAQRQTRNEVAVRPQTVARLKALRKAVPDDSRVPQLLGMLLLRRGDASEAVPMLRDALKLEPRQTGTHQMLAQTLLSVSPADPATIAEAAKLYRAGSKLIPNDPETYYQLGRMHNMMDLGRGGSDGGGKSGGKGGRKGGEGAPIGSKHDAATTAWRHAIALKPDMVEASQMLALRLAKARGKKTRTRARKLASKAARLAPGYAMSHYTVGMTHTSGTDDLHALRDQPREKAIAAIRRAVTMQKPEEPLPRERRVRSGAVLLPYRAPAVPWPVAPHTYMLVACWASRRRLSQRGAVCSSAGGRASHPRHAHGDSASRLQVVLGLQGARQLQRGGSARAEAAQIRGGRPDAREGHRRVRRAPACACTQGGAGPAQAAARGGACIRHYAHCSHCSRGTSARVCSSSSVDACALYVDGVLRAVGARHPCRRFFRLLFRRRMLRGRRTALNLGDGFSVSSEGCKWHLTPFASRAVTRVKSRFSVCRRCYSYCYVMCPEPCLERVGCYSLSRADGHIPVRSAVGCALLRMGRISHGISPGGRLGLEIQIVERKGSVVSPRVVRCPVYTYGHAYGTLLFPHTSLFRGPRCIRYSVKTTGSMSHDVTDFD